MARFFYTRIAVTNLRKNFTYNVPYLVASTFTMALFFLTLAILYNPGMDHLCTSSSIKMGFEVAMNVMVIFATVFFLYLNSFLLKRRKKEFGLYHIWGLEKRHIIRIILFENAILYVAALTAALLSGVVFGKLMFLLLLKICRMADGDSTFVFTFRSFWQTLLLFVGLYMVTSILNTIQIIRSKTIDLLKGGKYGEKKVRFLMPLTLLGIGLLAYAYYKANVISYYYIEAILSFFGLVALVIIATFILFTTGSIFLLTRLQKSKRFYYQPNHFVAVSGLFYRMKQNAAGLSNICILSSMVLITVISCISIYIGEENMVKQHTGSDLIITYGENQAEEAKSDKELILEKASQYGITMEEAYQYPLTYQYLLVKDGVIDLSEAEVTSENMERYVEEMRQVCFLTVKDYNAFSGEDLSLKDTETIVISNEDWENISAIRAGMDSFTIKEVISDSKLIDHKYCETTGELFVVLSSEESIEQLIRAYESLSEVSREVMYIYNYPDTVGEVLAFEQEVKRDTIGSVTGYHIKLEDVYAEFGGLLFIGIFFVILFMVATVLIIYFKQITEGNEDKERFEILQKVGMDERAVKNTINSQILIVFFMPLFGAILHTIAARHIIIKCMEGLYLMDTELITNSMIGTCLGFCLIYFIVYRLTANVYVRIVKR